MVEIINYIGEAERGGLLDLGKALRHLLTYGGGGGGGGPAVDAATYEEFRAGTEGGKYLSPSVFFQGNAGYTLTDTANIPVNMSFGINFLLTITADRTLTDPFNTKNGQQGIFVIQQDNVGGHNLTWGNNYKFPTSAPTLPQAPHAWTLIRYFVEAPTVIRCTVEGSSTNALNAATAEELWLGLESLKYVSPAVLIEAELPETLIEEDPIFVDLGAAKNFELTLTANQVVGSPIDQMPGRWGTITVYQGGAGTYDLTWHADWKSTDGNVPTVKKGVGAITVYHYRVVDVGNVQLTKELFSAAPSDVWAGTARDQYLSPDYTFEAMSDVTLPYAATVTPDLRLGLTFSLTLAGNCHIANPLGQRRGKAGRFFIQQNETGGYAVTWGTDFDFIGGVTPTIPAEPNGWTVVPYEVKFPGTILAASVEASGGGGSTTEIPAASTAEVKSAAAVAKYISPSVFHGFFVPYTLTDAATVTPDLDLGPNFILTINDNRTIANITHQRPGVGGYITIIQGAAGGKTVTWGNNYVFLGGTPTIPSTPGDWTTIPYIVRAFGIIQCITIQTSAIPGAASIAEVRAGTVGNKYIPPSVALGANALVTLTDAPVIAVDLATGINFKVILGGARAFANPTNQIAGRQGIIKVQQDATGGRTASWGSEYIFEDAAPVVPTGPNKHIVVAYHVESPGVVLMGQ